MPGTNIQAAVTSTLNLREVDITGLALTATCTGTPPATANTFSHGCIINQTDSGTGVAALYQNTGSSASPVWTLIDTALPGVGASTLIDTNSLTVVDVATVASQVNHLRVTPSATGAVSANAVLLQPNGTDAAISMSIQPVGATGLVGIGLSTGTGDITVGSSSATQAVKIGNGAGVSTVNLANASVAGANLNVATAATGAGITDTVAISTGNAAATGIKVVNILTGTPGTSGNNRLTIGGGATSAATVNAALTSYQDINYIATESGANNAIVASLLNSSGASVTVAAGLRVLIKLAHSLQAGANTFNLNGHGTDSIKKSTSPATDIGTAYVSGSIVNMVFDGTVWQVLSQ